MGSNHTVPQPAGTQSLHTKKTGRTCISRGRRTGRADAEELVVLLAGLSFATRTLPGTGAEEQLHSLFPACLSFVRPHDQDMHERVRKLDENAAAEDRAAEIQRQKREQRGGKKTKSTAGPVAAEVDATQHVDAMERILVKAGAREMGPFFDEFTAYGEGILGLQEMLKSEFDGTSGNSSVPISPELSAAMAKCKAALEFQVRHSSVPLGKPADWPPSQVLSFLSKSGVEAHPTPDHKVLVRVAQELLEFKKKMFWVCNNMPDDAEAARRGARELFGQDVDSDEETSVLVQSPLAADFDPTALPTRTLSALASLVLPGVAGVEGGGDAAGGGGDVVRELTRVLGQMVQGLDGRRDALYAVQDPEQTSAVWLQVLQVRDWDGGLCVEVKGLWCRRREMIGQRFDVVTTMLTEAQLPGAPGIVNLEASEGAVELLRSVLRRNRSRIKKSLTVSHEAKWPKGFKYSVIVEASEMGAKRCPVCGVLATKVCSRCRKMSYCCVEHQKVHWKTHKKECQPEQTDKSRKDCSPASTQ